MIESFTLSLFVYESPFYVYYFSSETDYAAVEKMGARGSRRCNKLVCNMLTQFFGGHLREKLFCPFDVW